MAPPTSGKKLPKRATEKQIYLSRKVKDLEEAGKNTLKYCVVGPQKREPNLYVPVLDLRLIKLSSASIPFLKDKTMLGFIASNDILPCVKQFEHELFEDKKLKSDLAVALSGDDDCFTRTTDYLAKKAPYYVTLVHKGLVLDHAQPDAMRLCLKYVRRLKCCSMAHFMHFLLEDRYHTFEDFLHTLAIRILLTVYLDLQANPKGFFAILFASRFSEPMDRLTRWRWDQKLILQDGEDKFRVDTADSVTRIQEACIASSKAQEDPPILDPDDDGSKHEKLAFEVCDLKNEFTTATGKDPKLIEMAPPQTGRRVLSESFRKNHKEKAKFDAELEYAKGDLESAKQDCARFDGANRRIKEAELSPQQPLFTFQTSETLIEPQDVPKEFNYYNRIDPFSDEETYVASTAHESVFDKNRDTMDLCFDWVKISQLLPGRDVADCIRFYYENKHIIYMHQEPALGIGRIMDPPRAPEWSPDPLPDDKVLRNRGIEADRYNEYYSEIEAKLTDLQIKADRCDEETREREQLEKMVLNLKGLVDRLSVPSGLPIDAKRPQDLESERKIKELEARVAEKNTVIDANKDLQAEIEKLHVHLAEERKKMMQTREENITLGTEAKEAREARHGLEYVADSWRGEANRFQRELKEQSEHSTRVEAELRVKEQELTTSAQHERLLWKDHNRLLGRVVGYKKEVERLDEEIERLKDALKARPLPTGWTFLDITPRQKKPWEK